MKLEQRNPLKMPVDPNVALDIVLEEMILLLDNDYDQGMVIREQISGSLSEKFTIEYEDYHEDGSSFMNSWQSVESVLAEDNLLQAILEQLVIDGYIHCENPDAVKVQLNKQSTISKALYL